MANLQQLRTQTVLNPPENVCGKDGKRFFLSSFLQGYYEEYRIFVIKK